MNVKNLFRIGIVAKKTGVPRTSIMTAIDRGEIAVYHSACKLPMVTLADVQKWGKEERPMGRPPKNG